MNQRLIIAGLGIIAMAGISYTSIKAEDTSVPRQDNQKAFETADEAGWEKVFSDPCTGDWKERWFLDGTVGEVSTSDQGMQLTAGPEFGNNAHHMVLWTKPSFEGDLKIEFDYTRLDDEIRCVNILFIQATGSGTPPFAKDIAEWNNLREVPAMRTYFDNMHTYHISFAAFRNTGESDEQYIRGRRYMPNKDGLKGTDLEPDYWFRGLFAKAVKHRVTVIKRGRVLHMRVANADEVRYFSMTNRTLPPITEGRIGLRHMFTRSAVYKNFAVFSPTE